MAQQLGVAGIGFGLFAESFGPARWASSSVGHATRHAGFLVQRSHRCPQGALGGRTEFFV